MTARAVLKSVAVVVGMLLVPLIAPIILLVFMPIKIVFGVATLYHEFVQWKAKKREEQRVLDRLVAEQRRADGVSVW